VKIAFYLFLIQLLFACAKRQDQKLSTNSYSHDVGDILFDAVLDDPAFLLCDSTKIITSRSALAYQGNRSAIAQVVKNQFILQPEYSTFSGFIVVRFIVNCKDQPGRFRLETLGMDFQRNECPKALTKHILSIIQELYAWSHYMPRYAKYDCAKFLNLKIVDGKIMDVIQ